MSDKVKVREGNDGYSYPYTSPDLVIDKNGKSNTKKFEEIDTQFKDIGNKKANKNEIKIIVNVKSFGAKGDGTTNDSPSINNALAYAKANKIMNVYIPEGQYIIDESPIKVHSGITFYGDGSDDPYNCGGD
jgi:polygalacturonase